MIAEVFDGSPGGFFVDIGSSDISQSPTYLLEKCLNWSGLCVDSNVTRLDLAVGNSRHGFTCDYIYLSLGRSLNACVDRTDHSLVCFVFLSLRFHIRVQIVCTFTHVLELKHLLRPLCQPSI